jgi:chromate transporter
MDDVRTIKLVPIFCVFFGVSAMTLGGGLAMVPVMARELTRRSWLEEDEFYLVFSEAQAFPGPIALSMSFFLGKRLRGWKGALAGCLGVLIPPVVSVVFVWFAVGALGRSRALDDFFDGVYATVPGLAAALVYRMLRKGKWGWPSLVYAALLAVALVVFRPLAVPVFFGACALWYLGRGLWKS